MNGLLKCPTTHFCNFLLHDNFSMGGVFSMMPDGYVENSPLGLSQKYCKSGSLKWHTLSIASPMMSLHLPNGECPSLLDLCVHRLSQVIQTLKVMLSLYLSLFLEV